MAYHHRAKCGAYHQGRQADLVYHHAPGVHSPADMLSKFGIALKECRETEGWLQLLFNTSVLDETTFKKHRNLCGRIRRMLISSCRTLKEKI
ncbi:MAG: four helix bundle protein [Ruminococcaceae bacterium]|nr:four helix bundle protein [Oscillospiraceae bacterium]MBQ9794176.1 four helix bundle protein [Clostridia bacterium]